MPQCGNCANSLSHFFLQKFRQSNVFTKQFTKELISRNIFSMRENLTFSGEYFVKISVLLNMLLDNQFDEMFFCESKLFIFTHCVFVVWKNEKNIFKEE